MKKLLIAFLLGVNYIPASACDVCGLGTSNYNPLLFPHLSKHYLSVNYLHRLYHTHSEEGINKAHLNTFFISGQYSINEKLQLVAMLPYQVNKQEIAGTTRNLKGAGDLTLLANYRLWMKQGRSNTQTLTVGGGFKLPTGKYTASKSGTIEDQNFQLGTGSVDYMLNASYRLSYRRWVFSAVGSYKYNTENKQNYRYGDIWATGATAVYRKELKDFSISPYLQIMKEIQLRDADDHIIQKHSGGSVLYSGGGFDVNTRKFSIGANHQFAAKQNLLQGEINAKPRLSIHFSIVL